VRYRGFHYQAASWNRPRRVIVKVEHHLGELFPRVGFIVTTLTGTNRAVVHFYNGRGTAEQWIKEGKAATQWTRLSCHRFRANEVRLLMGVIAYNLGNLLRRLALPLAIQNWSLTSLQQRIFKTGGRLIRHARYFTLAACPKLLDTAAVSADRRSHRATRVAPHVIESDGPCWEHAWRRGRECLEGGEAASRKLADLGDQWLGVARTVPVTGHEWPDRARRTPRGPLSSTRGQRTWSISEIPAKTAARYGASHHTDWNGYALCMGAKGYSRR
jgi:DDE family transposase